MLVGITNRWPDAVKEVTDDMKPSGMWMWLLATGVSLVMGVGNGKAQPATQHKLTPTSEVESAETAAVEELEAGPAANRLEPNVELPQFIRERMLLFNQMREEYLARHLALIHQLRDAANAQQAKLRERARVEREAWLQHGGSPAGAQMSVLLEGLNTDMAGQATEDGGELRQEPIFKPKLEHIGTE